MQDGKTGRVPNQLQLSVEILQTQMDTKHDMTPNISDVTSNTMCHQTLSRQGPTGEQDECRAGADMI